MTLTFYTHPQSRGRITHWMLEELGQPYETVVLDYGTTMKAPAYLAINPMGKVPAIVHRGKVVTECAAICAYLADAFPKAGLAPSPDNRGAYYRWMCFCVYTLMPAYREAGVSMVPTRPVSAVPRGGLTTYGTIAKTLQSMPRAVGQACGGHQIRHADAVEPFALGGDRKANDSFHWPKLTCEAKLRGK